MSVLDTVEEQLERLKLGGTEMHEAQKQHYLASEDNLGEVVKGAVVPDGYKRCGRCGNAKKFYLFNKNAGSKTNTSGSCKECQKGTAAKSYAKTKSKRNYKDYYQANKAMKQAHARKYYEQNKDTLKEKHKAYLGTKAGQRVMKKAHLKRRKALANNKGIPYTRAMVIDRDGAFFGLEHPECYLCNKPITSIDKSLHIDHVVPVLLDGLDCFSNVACSHDSCNLRKEKDARELTPEQVNEIISRSEAYIDAHPDKFEE